MRRASLLGMCLCGMWLGVLTGCETSALGRSQLKLLPESQMDQMGVAAFNEISQQTPVSSNSRKNTYVTCVASAVTRALTGPAAATRWEVKVFEDANANAFALPGGKIGVNTGLLDVARNQDQLATVLGHEVAHVLAGHSNERVSAALVKQAGMSALEVMADSTNPMHGQMLGLFGAGVEYGVLLPYGRAHESEADLMGLDLMARAGFDPTQSVALWQNMAAAGAGQPPEFLSTHPSHSTRIRDLEGRMPQARELSESARKAGRRPSCS